ncbi:LOW QUALITY PROTEIN: FHF complex subunit HOOK interacting protein 1B-like, partial [Apus apus]|uniref:LOW QUALITY PROTEIN: FHF complex subunit HOOK interacting protein 1B-like n=1 Tax=Apus apus TaxID=8895 RepID=UPI0021F864E1
GPGSPDVAAAPKPLTPSRLSFFSRTPGGTPPASPGTPSGSPRAPPPVRWDEVSELDGNYLEYLRDARSSIDRCAWACRVWSAPYDGDQPGPPPPTPRTKKRGLPEEGAPPAPPSSTEAGAGGPGPEDTGTLVNGAHEPAEPPGGDVVVKKVRRSPQGDGDGDDGTPPQSTAQKGPPRAGWEPLGSSVDSLLEELLARAPAEPQGGGVTIETFTQELREIEAEMKNGGGGVPAHTPGEQEEEEEDDEEETFALPEVGASGRGPPRLLDPLAQLVASPPRPVGPPPSQPFTGPFVSALFSKLENMLHNSLYVNFLLTGLVAQLASYPQPLLRSFLLNTNMVFQPSVKSLLQVLGSVKNKIESFAAGQEDFPALLLKAKKYLIARGRLDWAEPPGTLPALRRPDSLARSRRPSLGELILRHTQSPARARPALPTPREGLGGAGGGHGQALRVRNAVYCAVIFCEFLKELAAIAQAHAVTSPFLTEPPEE